MRVRPSGLLPSTLKRPTGSLVEGKPARVKLRKIMSFRAACLEERPGPRGQESPCKPSAATEEPQGHLCGSQRGTPSRRPTATLTDSSSSLSPHEVIGRASNQSPACGAETALRRA